MMKGILSQPSRTSGIRTLAGITALALLSVGGFLWMSQRTYGMGFPLDDAWIHQTYARNLAQYGEWSFQPGKPSAGSTAPLWSMMLALGHWLKIEPRTWAYGLGTLALILCAWMSGIWLAQRTVGHPEWAKLIPLLVVLEWHLVWAAVSGMEIPALALVIVLVLWSLDAGQVNDLLIGLLIGCGMWIRPDAVTLLLPSGWHILLRKGGTIGGALRRFLRLGFGFALLVVPYLAFNYSLSGEWWPSTFYAKQAEYAVFRQLSYPLRWLRQLGLPMVGLGAVLAPGVLIEVAESIQAREWRRLAPFLWVLAFLGVYALRLPVTYQHGRYAMPVMPVWIVLGGGGMLRWLRPRAAAISRRVLSRAWPMAVLTVGVAFWFSGGQAYAQDVAIIETEMVATARWIAQNVPSQSLVAAHDIGALGYFSSARLLDLAGLVSPEVVPFIRDEHELAVYLEREKAAYLMTFPKWYPRLAQIGEPIFTTGAPYSLQADGENMVVYRLPFGAFAP